MRIYITSDTHNSTIFKNFEDDGTFDAIVHCGDYTNNGLLGGIDDLKTINFLSGLKTPLYHIPGNHDRGIGTNRTLFGINFLDTIVEIAGLNFLGLSLSPCYDMEFLYYINDRVVKDPDIEKKYYLSKPPADVIISHCPPTNCGTMDMTKDNRSIGSKYLYEYILMHKPKYVFCGHRHTNKVLSHYIEESNTLVYNLATQYLIKNFP